MAAELVSFLPAGAPAPCEPHPQLFDSPKLLDHYDARQLCLTCPITAACRETAEGDRDATGTYGGVLIRRGVVMVDIDPVKP